MRMRLVLRFMLPPWCPAFEVRDTSRHPLTQTSEAGRHSLADYRQRTHGVHIDARAVSVRSLHTNLGIKARGGLNAQAVIFPRLPAAGAARAAYALLPNRSLNA